MSDIERRFNSVQEVEPDNEDIMAIERIKQANDTDEGITLEQLDRFRGSEYSGKITVRIPKTLHKELVTSAKGEGISLNQYILYKLAK